MDSQKKNSTEGGFKLPSSNFKPRNLSKLKKENLNLFDSEFQAKNTNNGFVNAPMSVASSSCSGQKSPTMTALSTVTSLMNQECKAILEERLYQLQQALTRMKQGLGNKEFEHIVK